MEHRRYSRFSLTFAGDFDATIYREGQTYQGRVQDISLGGMYVNIYDELPVDEIVEVLLHPTDDPTGPSFKCDARVVRSGQRGIAMEIVRISEDNRLRLRSLLHTMCMDPDLVDRELEEFLKHVG